MLPLFAPPTRLLVQSGRRARRGQPRPLRRPKRRRVGGLVVARAPRVDAGHVQEGSSPRRASPLCQICVVTVVAGAAERCGMTAACHSTVILYDHGKGHDMAQEPSAASPATRLQLFKELPPNVLRRIRDFVGPRRRQKLTPGQRLAIAARQRFRCANSKSLYGECRLHKYEDGTFGFDCFHCDHVVPFSRGGSDQFDEQNPWKLGVDNWQALCPACHAVKSRSEAIGHQPPHCNLDGASLDKILRFLCYGI